MTIQFIFFCLCGLLLSFTNYQFKFAKYFFNLVAETLAIIIFYINTNILFNIIKIFTLKLKRNGIRHNSEVPKPTFVNQHFLHCPL